MAEVDGYIVSWSELSTYRQCPMKWHLSYEQRWQKDVESTSPLGKGVLWHEVMETHYKVIQSKQIVNEAGFIVWSLSVDEMSAATRQAVDALLIKAQRRGTDLEVIDLMWWMYQGYLEVYGLDQNHDILGVETTHLVPLGEIGDPRDPEPVWLKFKIDRTVRDERGRTMVLDEKSHGVLPTESDYQFMDQFMLYQWGLQKLGIRVDGCIHSAAKTTRNQGDIIKPGDDGYKKSMKAQTLEDRFKRTYIPYTQAQLQCAADDALADARLMYSDFNHRRRHTDSLTCKRMCGFKEACLFGRRTGKESDMLSMLEATGWTQNYERH